MKKILACISMILTMAAGAMAAGTVTTSGGSGYGPWQTGQGGEFTLVVLTGTDIDLLSYDSRTRNQGGTSNSFQTFCIEGNEYIYPNTVAGYTIGSAAEVGGLNVGTGPAGTMGYPDEVSRGAAWLYSNFAKGLNFNGITSYNYTAAGRNADAALLQNALWFLENETATIDTSNKFYLAVKSFFSDDANLTNARANANGEYGVRALNIFNPSNPSQKYQTQLVLSVPDAGFTLGLLGLGLSGLFLVSRKFRQV